jgi:glycosyltransferase involved in cell wall biosynthesis
MILFSVIIPTYNRAGFIVEAVDTVLKQTYQEFEIIVVDDGSIDNTGEVINNKYRSDSRVRYFHKQNEERGAARNFGLRQAKGQYAVFFDSDDLMKPHYLATLAGIIDKYPGVYLLAGSYNFIGDDKKEIPAPTIELKKEGWYNREFFLEGNILACNFSICIKNPGYHFFQEERELVSMEDWLFLLSNLEKEKIYIVKDICLSMREHDERTMGDNQKVIKAKRKATTWALEHLQLGKSERNKLMAWSSYFCGIHQYLDFKRRAALREALHAIRRGGMNRNFLSLFLKAFLGRKLIKKLK